MAINRLVEHRWFIQIRIASGQVEGQRKKVAVSTPAMPHFGLDQCSEASYFALSVWSLPNFKLDFSCPNQINSAHFQCEPTLGQHCISARHDNIPIQCTEGWCTMFMETASQVAVLSRQLKSCSRRAKLMIFASVAFINFCIMSRMNPVDVATK